MVGDTFAPPSTEDARPEGINAADTRFAIFMSGDLRIPVLHHVEYGAKKLRNKAIALSDRYAAATYSKERDALVQEIEERLPADNVADIRRASDQDIEEYVGDYRQDQDAALNPSLPPQLRDVVVELEEDLDLSTMESVLQEYEMAWTQTEDELHAWDGEEGGLPDYICSSADLYTLGGSLKDRNPPLEEGENKRLKLLSTYLRH